VECVLVYHLMDYLNGELKEVQLHKSFTEVEMPVVILLAKMELNGFGKLHRSCFNTSTCTCT